MKRKILLTFVITSFIVSAEAQKNKQKTTAYAITAAQKGSNSWTEVKLVDVATGEEQSIYKSSDEMPILNARTGKPVVKKDVANSSLQLDRKKEATEVKILKQNLTLAPLERRDDGEMIRIVRKDANNNNVITERKILISHTKVQSDKPFATNSAACAYDRKHDRLYYTPMGINQLRYIDLKSKSPKIYYFEDEPLGALSSPRDVPNQITRMVIAADGDGYALTNNGDHLIRFTTNKKAVITDLGALSDDPANGNYSIHAQNGYGGDMIAGKNGDLYLITANRNVFAINIESKVASYKGTIKGLPRGYTTNGAIVEDGTSIIVNSSNSTLGYFRFDLNTMQAEKISNGEVFNSSDLANATLVSDKKKNEKEEPTEVKPELVTTSQRVVPGETVHQYKFSVYPNPVTTGMVKLSFEDHPQGKYKVQLMDISGKIISTQDVTVTNKMQVEEFRMPKLIAAGNYMLKVTGEGNKVFNVEQVVIQ